MKFVADLHLHSKYSRAVSQNMTLPNLAHWTKLKGINVVGTGDFTHPFWFDQLKNELEDVGNGLLRLKSTVDSSQFTVKNGQQSTVNREPIYFLLSCEVSSIYSQGGKVRRIHNLFFFPSLAAVEQFNKKLLGRGANLRSDGRPTVGIGARDLAQIALSCDEKALIIPAHAWTPWFSVFGAFSGFDSIGECFGDMSQYIYGIETGLSSDPAMNWQIGDLDNRSILSSSDAHSLEKMGREATVFEAEEISYDCIYQAIAKKWEVRNEKLDKEVGSKKSHILPRGEVNPASHIQPHISFTIEFYPEEGKYHFTGHRECNFSQSPEETSANGSICPVCKRPLTIGVMHRVEELKTRNQKQETRNISGVRWVYPQGNGRPGYVSMVPLGEILAEALGVAVGTKKVIDSYYALVNNLDNEFNVLLKSSLSEIEKIAGSRVADGIGKVRAGEIVVTPGFDGKFGQVKIWQETFGREEKDENAQLNLFA